MCRSDARQIQTFFVFSIRWKTVHEMSNERVHPWFIFCCVSPASILSSFFPMILRLTLCVRKIGQFSFESEFSCSRAYTFNACWLVEFSDFFFTVVVFLIPRFLFCVFLLSAWNSHFVFEHSSQSIGGCICFLCNLFFHFYCVHLSFDFIPCVTFQHFCCCNFVAKINGKKRSWMTLLWAESEVEKTHWNRKILQNFLSTFFHFSSALNCFRPNKWNERNKSIATTGKIINYCIVLLECNECFWSDHLCFAFFRV